MFLLFSWLEWKDLIKSFVFHFIKSFVFHSSQEEKKTLLNLVYTYIEYLVKDTLLHNLFHVLREFGYRIGYKRSITFAYMLKKNLAQFWFVPETGGFLWKNKHNVGWEFKTNRISLTVASLEKLNFLLRWFIITMQQSVGNLTA